MFINYYVLFFNCYFKTGLKAMQYTKLIFQFPRNFLSTTEFGYLKIGITFERRSKCFDPKSFIDSQRRLSDSSFTIHTSPLDKSRASWGKSQQQYDTNLCRLWDFFDWGECELYIAYDRRQSSQRVIIFMWGPLENISTCEVVVDHESGWYRQRGPLGYF